MALLAGFVLKSETLREELGLSPLIHGLWLFMVRYVSPLGILLIFVDAWVARYRFRRPVALAGAGAGDHHPDWRTDPSGIEARLLP